MLIRSFLILLCITLSQWGYAYPIDGAARTGIDRLDGYNLRLHEYVRGVKQPVEGARLTSSEIGLRLYDEGLVMNELPERDSQLEKQIRGLLGGDRKSVV